MKKRLLLNVLTILGLSFSLSCGDTTNFGNQLGLDPTFGVQSNCDFQLSTILNGPSASAANSFWVCQSVVNSLLVTQHVALYNDGTGEIADADEKNISVITWKQTGCRSLKYKSPLGEGDFTNVEGSLVSGVYTATDHSAIDGNNYFSTCRIERVQ